MVDTPLCKECGETANVILNKRERKKRGWVIVVAVLGIIFTVFLVIALAVDVYNDF